MRKIVFLFLLIIFMFGCSKNKLYQNLPVAEKMKIANAFFDRGKYHKAIPLYSDIAFERNSILTAEAQMKLAECYFLQNKFMDARFELEEMIRLFPDYENISNAYYKIGICFYEESLNPHYTQEETERAIDAFEIFLEKFPFAENRDKAVEFIQKCHYKLLKKKYNNGYAYYKLYDYSSALMYFNEIIELGNQDKLDRMSLFYSTKIYIFRKNNENALKTAGALSMRYPDSKEVEKINKLLKKLN